MVVVVVGWCGRWKTGKNPGKRRSKQAEDMVVGEKGGRQWRREKKGKRVVVGTQVVEVQENGGKHRQEGQGKHNRKKSMVVAQRQIKCEKGKRHAMVVVVCSEKEGNETAVAGKKAHGGGRGRRHGKAEGGEGWEAEESGEVEEMVAWCGVCSRTKW